MVAGQRRTEREITIAKVGTSCLALQYTYHVAAGQRARGWVRCIKPYPLVEWGWRRILSPLEKVWYSGGVASWARGFRRRFGDG